MATTDWMAQARAGVVVDIGQIDHAQRRQLNNAAKRGEVAKWRGYWTPIPGASFGLGPAKTCYGPLGSQQLLP
jgi:hypothetical protein